jgi:hypothetical protein
MDSHGTCQDEFEAEPEPHWKRPACAVLLRERPKASVQRKAQQVAIKEGGRDILSAPGGCKKN